MLTDLQIASQVGKNPPVCFKRSCREAEKRTWSPMPRNWALGIALARDTERSYPWGSFLVFKGRSPGARGGVEETDAQTFFQVLLRGQNLVPSSRNWPRWKWTSFVVLMWSMMSEILKPRLRFWSGRTEWRFGAIPKRSGWADRGSLALFFDITF